MEQIPVIVLILLASSFTKIFTTLTILKVGLGLPQIGSAIVTVLLSLALAWVVMEPTFSHLPKGNNSWQEHFSVVRPFLDRYSDPDIKSTIRSWSELRDLSHDESEESLDSTQGHLGDSLLKGDLSADSKEAGSLKKEKAAAESECFEGEVDNSSSPALVLAVFLLSELQDAFLLGLTVLIPLLAVDIVVLNLLMILGVTQVSVNLVTLPLKLFLFVVLDGWGLIGHRLLREYL